MEEDVDIATLANCNDTPERRANKAHPNGRQQMS